MTRGRQEMRGGRGNTSRRARWAPVLAALVLALVALVAFGGVNAASAASATKHTTHTTHSKKKPTPTQPAFALDFTCAQGWNWATSALADVCVHTQPGAKLAITVKACGRLVNDAALKGTATANDKGDYAWTWTPAPTCMAMHATVKATSGGKSVTKSTSFTLQKLNVPSA